jgi:hypothetical protein
LLPVRNASAGLHALPAPLSHKRPCHSLASNQSRLPLHRRGPFARHCFIGRRCGTCSSWLVSAATAAILSPAAFARRVVESADPGSGCAAVLLSASALASADVIRVASRAGAQDDDAGGPAGAGALHAAMAMRRDPRGPGRLTHAPGPLAGLGRAAAASAIVTQQLPQSPPPPARTRSTQQVQTSPAVVVIWAPQTSGLPYADLTLECNQPLNFSWSGTTTRNLYLDSAGAHSTGRGGPELS